MSQRFSQTKAAKGDGYLIGLAERVAALARLQSETAAELDALLPSILDRVFQGEL